MSKHLDDIIRDGKKKPTKEEKAWDLQKLPGPRNATAIALCWMQHIREISLNAYWSSPMAKSKERRSAMM